MSSPMRYTTGVTNVHSGQTLGQFFAPDPTKMHVYFNDFNDYTAAEWTVTETSGGATEALADGDDGILLLTNTGADNDLLAMNLVPEGFVMEAGKKAWFKAKWQMSEATSMDAVIGLIVIDSAPIAGAPSDGVYFRKDDGDTNWDFAIQASSVAISAAAGIATSVASTDITLGWYFDGIDTFEYFVNDTLAGSAETTGFPTTELSVLFAIQAGSANARTASLDYVFAAKER